MIRGIEVIPDHQSPKEDKKMANVKSVAKVNATKETKSKETKVMAKKNQEVKEVATKEVEKKVVKNENKLNLISIDEVTAMYGEAGIQCKNPNAKGAYRIMKGGSSLNIKPTKGYYIYSTDDDYAQIVSSGLKTEDLVCEEGTNAQDKTRPHTIICTKLDTLKSLIALYAMNPLNKVATETTAVATK